jgi:hypothetical protein
MRLHERTQTVGIAQSEIETAFLKLVEAKGLTPAETFVLLGRLITQQAMFALRLERHGTYDKKADEA